MRGDLFRVKAASGTVGREQQGGRFAVVVQSGFVQPPTLLVAPLPGDAGFFYTLGEQAGQAELLAGVVRRRRPANTGGGWPGTGCSARSRN